MAGTMDIIIREMKMEDYDQVYALWTEIKGFGIRTVDDSREGVERFLRRNPTTSVVAVQNGRVIGNILCGHDGRTASMELDTVWCGLPWRLCTKKASARLP